MAVNKISLNVSKVKYVIFHKPKDSRCDFRFRNKWNTLERMKNFNILGLQVNENMSWKSDIDVLDNKFAKCAWPSLSGAQQVTRHFHDDVIKWKHFPCYWPFVRGMHRSPVNSPHKGQWRGALMLSLIWALTNGWVNNRHAGDLRRNRAHYDVTVMHWCQV